MRPRRTQAARAPTSDANHAADANAETSACPSSVTPSEGIVVTDGGAVAGAPAGTTWGHTNIPYAAHLYVAELRTSWSAFASTLDPNAAGVARWPRWTAALDEHSTIDEIDPATAVGKRVGTAQRDFSDTLLP